MYCGAATEAFGQGLPLTAGAEPIENAAQDLVVWQRGAAALGFCNLAGQERLDQLPCSFIYFESCRTHPLKIIRLPKFSTLFGPALSVVSSSSWSNCSLKSVVRLRPGLNLEYMPSISADPRLSTQLA